MTDNGRYRTEGEQVSRDYREGKISLQTLVDIFESYVDARESENAPDFEELRGAWLQIEIINAVRWDDPTKASKNETAVRGYIQEFLDLLP